MSKGPKEEGPLPEGWQVQYSSSTKTNYYYNNLTGESTWSSEPGKRQGKEPSLNQRDDRRKRAGGHESPHSLDNFGGSRTNGNPPRTRPIPGEPHSRERPTARGRSDHPSDSSTHTAQRPSSHSDSHGDVRRESHMQPSLVDDRWRGYLPDQSPPRRHSRDTPAPCDGSHDGTTCRQSAAPTHPEPPAHVRSVIAPAPGAGRVLSSITQATARSSAATVPPPPPVRRRSPESEVRNKDAGGHRSDASVTPASNPPPKPAPQPLPSIHGRSVHPPPREEAKPTARLSPLPPPLPQPSLQLSPPALTAPPPATTTLAAHFAAPPVASRAAAESGAPSATTARSDRQWLPAGANGAPATLQERSIEKVRERVRERRDDAGAAGRRDTGGGGERHVTSAKSDGKRADERRLDRGESRSQRPSAEVERTARRSRARDEHSMAPGTHARSPAGSRSHRPPVSPRHSPPHGVGHRHGISDNRRPLSRAAPPSSPLLPLHTRERSLSRSSYSRSRSRSRLRLSSRIPRSRTRSPSRSGSDVSPGRRSRRRRTMSPPSPGKSSTGTIGSATPAPLGAIPLDASAALAAALAAVLGGLDGAGAVPTVFPQDAAAGTAPGPPAASAVGMPAQVTRTDHEAVRVPPSEYPSLPPVPCAVPPRAPPSGPLPIPYTPLPPPHHHHARTHPPAPPSLPLATLPPPPAPLAAVEGLVRTALAAAAAAVPGHRLDAPIARAVESIVRDAIARGGTPGPAAAAAAAARAALAFRPPGASADSARAHARVHVHAHGGRPALPTAPAAPAAAPSTALGGPSEPSYPVTDAAALAAKGTASQPTPATIAAGMAPDPASTLLAALRGLPGAVAMASVPTSLRAAVTAVCMRATADGLPPYATVVPGCGEGAECPVDGAVAAAAGTMPLVPIRLDEAAVPRRVPAALRKLAIGALLPKKAAIHASRDAAAAVEHSVADWLGEDGISANGSDSLKENDENDDAPSEGGSACSADTCNDRQGDAAAATAEEEAFLATPLGAALAAAAEHGVASDEASGSCCTGTAGTREHDPSYRDGVVRSGDHDDTAALEGGCGSEILEDGTGDDGCDGCQIDAVGPEGIQRANTSEEAGGNNDGSCRNELRGKDLERGADEDACSQLTSHSSNEELRVGFHGEENPAPEIGEGADEGAIPEEIGKGNADPASSPGDSGDGEFECDASVAAAATRLESRNEASVTTADRISAFPGPPLALP